MGIGILAPLVVTASRSRQCRCRRCRWWRRLNPISRATYETASDREAARGHHQKLLEVRATPSKGRRERAGCCTEKRCDTWTPPPRVPIRSPDNDPPSHQMQDMRPGQPGDHGRKSNNSYRARQQIPNRSRRSIVTVQRQNPRQLHQIFERYVAPAARRRQWRSSGLGELTSMLSIIFGL
jgi:hypothetical protein